MKIQIYTLITMLLYLSSSCVGLKKYKALEIENTKITNTFLQTKTDLAIAKRQLNKNKDASYLSNERQTTQAVALKDENTNYQTKLKKTKDDLLVCQQEKKELKNKISTSNAKHAQKIKPLEDLQKELKTHNKALLELQNTLAVTLGASDPIRVSFLLDKEELILTFEHKYLFSTTSYYLSSEGKSIMENLAMILNEKKSILIDIISYNEVEKNNWKISAKKSLAIISILQSKGVLPYRMTGQSRSPSPTTLGINLESNQIKLILHYPKKHLLKRIPLNN